MTTSGSKNFALTRNDICESALRKLGEYDKGEAPTADEISDATMALNVMINEWAGVQGADIFLRTELTLFINKGQESYEVGVDHITDSYDTTATDADAVETDTDISVESVSGMLVGDYIGLKLDDGTMHWSTISAIAAPIVTLNDALTGDSGSSSVVYTYTTKATKPVKISSPYRSDAYGVDTDMGKIGEDEYRDISLKGQTGVPNSIFYRVSPTGGTYFLWPTGDGAANTIKFIAHYYPDDFTVASDAAEFPVEWSQALIWGLAAELSFEYQIGTREKILIAQVAGKRLEDALDADVENASVRFTMENRG